MNPKNFTLDQIQKAADALNVEAILLIQRLAKTANCNNLEAMFLAAIVIKLIEDFDRDEMDLFNDLLEQTRKTLG
jgi:hypothetical protein